MERNVLDFLEETDIPCSLFVGGGLLLGPADFPVAAENQKGAELYAKDNGSCGQGGGKVLNALVVFCLSRTSCRAWRNRRLRVRHGGQCRRRRIRERGAESRIKNGMACE